MSISLRVAPALAFQLTRGFDLDSLLVTVRQDADALYHGVETSASGANPQATPKTHFVLTASSFLLDALTANTRDTLLAQLQRLPQLQAILKSSPAVDLRELQAFLLIVTHLDIVALVSTACKFFTTLRVFHPPIHNFQVTQPASRRATS